MISTLDESPRLQLRMAELREAALRFHQDARGEHDTAVELYVAAHEFAVELDKAGIGHAFRRVDPATYTYHQEERQPTA